MSPTTALPEPPPKDTFTERLRYIRSLGHPSLRGYLTCVLGAMAVILMNNFQRGGPVSIVGPLMFAIPALFFRWTIAPPLFLIAALYFQVLPFGVPLGTEYAVPVSESHFQLPDLMFTSAIVLYLICQFRLYSLTDRAYPDEESRTSRQRQKDGEKRPLEAITESELPRFLFLIAMVVLAGQLTWLIWSHLEVAPRSLFPLRIRPDPRIAASSGGYQMSPELSRFIILVCVLGLFLVISRVILGIWKWSRFSAEEGRLLLLDGSWNEQRRELARLETWRAWPRMSVMPKPKTPPPLRTAEAERGNFTLAAAVRVILILLGFILLYVVLLAIFVNWP